MPDSAEVVAEPMAELKWIEDFSSSNLATVKLSTTIGIFSFQYLRGHVSLYVAMNIQTPMNFFSSALFVGLIVFAFLLFF